MNMKTDEPPRIRVDDSMRERITQISMQRKESAKSSKIRNERKKEIFSATGRWTSDFDGNDSVPFFLDHSPDFPGKKRKKKGKKSGRSSAHSRRSLSEHSGKVFLEATGVDGGNDGRVRRSRSNDGQLGRLLGEGQKTESRLKRRGARTIASMPTTTGRGSIQNSRSESPEEIKRHHKVPETKKKVESPNFEKVKGSHSQGGLKKRTTRVQSKSSKMGNDSRNSLRSNEGKLGQLLGETEGTKRRKGSRSVASAPTVRGQRTKNQRSSERKQTSMRRSKSSSGNPSDTMGDENSERKQKSMRRSKSSSGNPSDTKGDGDSERKQIRRTKSSSGNPSETKGDGKSPRLMRSSSVDAATSSGEAQGSPGSLSQGLSRRLKSLKNFVGISGNNSSSAYSGTNQSEQAPKRNGERQSKPELQVESNKTRSSSAGPLGRPRQRREDRRATMTKMKQNDKDVPNTGSDDDDEGRPDLPKRAQSMMLHRDMTRRGKSNSLANLVNYSEEEIHSTSYFASNHVLVNRERMKRGLRPLTRDIAMDELARKNAEKVAESAGVSAIPATYVGNVLRGESIRAIHKAVMQNKDGRERANMLNPYFQDFGVGTSLGKDGMLYICQLFSERLELTVTDAT